MNTTKRFVTLIACFALLGVTGCVGPMGCGPMGCGPKGACGPIALSSCGGGGGDCNSGSCGGGDCDGCGELYVDPWVNHPPTGDPCDCCGNHNGQSCGRCRSVFDGFASLWGYRCDGGGGCDGACGKACASPILGGCGGGCGGSCGGCESSCGVEQSCGGCDSGCSTCGGGHDQMYISGDSMPPGTYVESQPTRAFLPQRTRQIFKPRGSIAEGNRGRVEY
jgi:hypothetical protein